MRLNDNCMGWSGRVLIAVWSMGVSAYRSTDDAREIIIRNYRGEYRLSEGFRECYGYLFAPNDGNLWVELVYPEDHETVRRPRRGGSRCE